MVMSQTNIFGSINKYLEIEVRKAAASYSKTQVSWNTGGGGGWGRGWSIKLTFLHILPSLGMSGSIPPMAYIGTHLSLLNSCLHQYQ